MEYWGQKKVTKTIWRIWERDSVQLLKALITRHFSSRNNSGLAISTSAQAKTRNSMPIPGVRGSRFWQHFSWLSLVNTSSGKGLKCFPSRTTVILLAEKLAFLQSYRGSERQEGNLLPCPNLRCATYIGTQCTCWKSSECSQLVKITQESEEQQSLSYNAKGCFKKHQKAANSGKGHRTRRLTSTGQETGKETTWTTKMDEAYRRTALTDSLQNSLLPWILWTALLGQTTAELSLGIVRVENQSNNGSSH